MKKTFTAKKFICVFLVIYLIASSFCVGLVYFIDPFFNYRLPDDVSCYNFDQDYCPTWKVGISKHQKDCNAIWVGSSLSTHVDVKYIEKQLGLNCATGIISAGRPNIYRVFIENAMKNNSIDTVFYETVVDHWMWEYNGTEYDMNMVPKYIQTDTILDDGEYFFNKNAIEESFITLNKMIKNKKNPPIVESEQETSVIDGETDIQNQIIPKDTVFSVENMAAYVQSNYTRYVTADDIKRFKKIGIKTINDNIAPLLKNNPDTKFVFVVPPCGVIEYVSLYNAGLVQEYLEAEKSLYKRLLQYDNAQIICARLDFEFNENLDNYMDDGHFCPQGAYNEIDYIKSGKYELTLDNIDEMLNKYVDCAKSFKWPFLKENFIGSEVEALQKDLISLGYEVDELGTYGEKTKEAISEFQAKNGLKVTGICFEETRNMIKKLVNP